MWSELSTVEAILDCRSPFSFYFDLVDSYWKSPNGRSLALHRLCTLARKQGASFIVIESALTRDEVREEIDDLDLAHGGGGAAEAVSISFFCNGSPPDDLANISDDEFLGQAVVINYRAPTETDFSISYVYEGILHAPAMRDESGTKRPLLNNYLCRNGEFPCSVMGRQFVVKGQYYCQQNSVTHVCAHACLRMVLASAGKGPVTARSINDFLKIGPHSRGLTISQVIEVIESHGLYADAIDCSTMEPEVYTSILSSIVESGDQALLVFTTGSQPTASPGQLATEHVVTVFGHTRNSDEWHPQAIPAYAGPSSALYYPASNWIDHFLINDDNFGPYYTLSSQALEFDDDVKAHWIVSVRDSSPTVRPHLAEAVASIQLANILHSLAPLSSGRWFEYVTRHHWKYVLRTLLVSRDEYIAHLTNSAGHDLSRADSTEFGPVEQLPDKFWIVEFTLPALFTGNRSKLGEVLVNMHATVVDVDLLTLGMRVPGLFLLKDASSGKLVETLFSLNSHSPMLRKAAHEHEW